MTYGERIRLLRSLQNISQKELADNLGMKPQQLSQYERDDRTPRETTLIKIANALGVPLTLLKTPATDELDFLLAAESFGFDISDYVQTSIVDISHRTMWPETHSEKDKIATKQIGKGLYLENLKRAATELDMSGIETLTRIARTLKESGRFDEKG